MSTTKITEFLPSFLDQSSVEYFLNDRPEMVSYVPLQAKTILEIGCGAGVFLSRFKESAELWGIEPDPRAAALAAERLDYVRIGTVEEQIQSLPSNYFDCVVFNDVLEHLVDPWQILQKTRGLLRKHGCVTASIPNIRYFRAVKEICWDGDFKYIEHGIFDKTHLRFYTRKSILRLFTDTGYRIEVIEGIPLPTNLRGKAWQILKAGMLVLPVLDEFSYMQIACVATPLA